jgi:hypothetical protein
MRTPRRFRQWHYVCMDYSSSQSISTSVFRVAKARKELFPNNVMCIRNGVATSAGENSSILNEWSIGSRAVDKTSCST